MSIDLWKFLIHLIPLFNKPFDLPTLKTADGQLFHSDSFAHELDGKILQNPINMGEV
jgi:hypothetical protein